MAAGGSVAWKGRTDGCGANETRQENRFGGLGIWGVTLRTRDRPEGSIAIGKAAGTHAGEQTSRGHHDVVVERVQGAWAGVNSACGKALEALAAGAPPRSFDGVAGPVAGVVEHGEGPGALGARLGGRRSRRGGGRLRRVLRSVLGS